MRTMSGCWLRFDPDSCPTFRLTRSRMGYRIVQRAVRIDDGTTRVDSVLSPDGRVLRRTVSSPPGVTVAVATVPASRLDWLGTQKRFVDHPGLDIVRMGVRAYDPHLGRFLSQDPIVGGSANDYDYVNADPINGTDLGGTCGVWGNPWKKCRGKRRGSTTSACFTFSGYLGFGGKSALCYRFRDGAPGRGRVGGAVGAGMGTPSLGAGVSIGRSNARTAAEVRGVSGYGGGGIGPVGAECAGGSSDLRPGRGRFIGDCAATLGRNWFPWPEGHVGIQLSG
ncbi:MAG: hypothetical protein RLY23_1416 [Actinomycetota bacterium]|jgi:RHS repeat-associated protein